MALGMDLVMSGAHQGSITVGDQRDEIVETASFSLPASLPPEAEYSSDSALHFLGTRAPSTSTGHLMGSKHEEAWIVVM